MKVNIEIDITPDELRKFIGLPNVELLQTEFVKLAGQYLEGAVQRNDVGKLVSPLLSAAMQPWANYQKWLADVVTGRPPDAKTAAQGDTKGEAKSDQKKREP